MWEEVSGNLPSDFGLPIAVHPREPETIYVVPILSDAEHYPPEGKLRVYRSRSGGGEWEALTRGLPQKNCHANVLRDSLAVDAFEPCGLYMGTTEGTLFASADEGETGKAPTLAATFDALEEAFPVLRGTVREHGTGERRAYMRVFACGRDLSFDPPAAPLPDEMIERHEPRRIVGAIAGG